MKCTLIVGALLGVSNAAALPKKEPSFKPEQGDLTQAYVAAAIEQGANRRCNSWRIDETAKHVFYPTCDAWLLDPSQQKDYTLVGTKLTHGRCGSWEVLNVENKIIPHCTGVRLHSGSGKIIEKLPKLELAHETRDEKKEPSFKHDDFPPSLINADTAIEHAGDKICSSWSLHETEQAIIWPRCDVWLWQPSGQVPDYVLVGTRVHSGSCQDWRLRFDGNQVSAECADKKRRDIEGRQTQSESEDYSITKGNAITSDHKRGAIA